ncbi:hypothetical protein NDU88_000557 [Pleurodeles waltl]|uniref:Uncharacterized protein n=1 Tax=Pleurodeles waltl TaxID=8319 RepID=A0AAV7LW55_PLEWA|nr:hypothetical protein NDU88_000557 [Pleurodeles waltl]
MGTADCIVDDVVDSDLITMTVVTVVVFGIRVIFGGIVDDFFDDGGLDDLSINGPDNAFIEFGKFEVEVFLP